VHHRLPVVLAARVDGVALQQRIHLQQAMVAAGGELRLQQADGLVHAGQHAALLGEHLHGDHGIAPRVQQRVGRAHEVAVREPPAADARIELEELGRILAQPLVQRLAAVLPGNGRCLAHASGFERSVAHPFYSKRE